MPDFSNWKRDVLIELVAALILIGLIAIAGCRNDAITYGGRAYTCSAGDVPECKNNGAVIVERK